MDDQGEIMITIDNAFRADVYKLAMPQLRAVVHAEGGFARLVFPDGKQIITTQWYAIRYCIENPTWTWEPL